MYDVKNFLKKFKNIPERDWCRINLEFNNQHCALGHCGVKAEDIIEHGAIKNVEATALANLLRPVCDYPHGTDFEVVFSINDNIAGHPKQNIISALEKVRDKELSEANVIEASKLINNHLEVIH